MSADLENQQPEDNIIAFQGKDDASITDSDKTGVTKVYQDGDYIQFGNERYRRDELIEAFGGMMNPGLAPPPKHNLANPAPLGLSAFALTTFVLSLINCEARDVTVPNIVVGLAFFYGGFAQLVAGMFEIACGNTFGGVALSSYGGFWGCWAALHVDSFGITSAYEGEETQLRNAIGLFLIGWFIFTFFLMVLTLKSTVAFFSIFFLLSMTFLLLAISEFQNSVPVKKAGGVFGLLTAFAAWYNAYAGLANKQNTYLTVKALRIPDLQNKEKKI